MMESANLWEGDDLACFGALDRPGTGQRQVSARAVSIATKISHFCRSLCRLRGILTLTCFPGSGPRIVRKLSVRFSVTNRGASREEVEVQRTPDCVHSAPGGGRNERRGGLPQGGDFSADLLLNEHLPGGLGEELGANRTRRLKPASPTFDNSSRISVLTMC